MSCELSNLTSSNSSPGTMTSLLFLEHSRQAPISRPLHLLSSRPGMLLFRHTQPLEGLLPHLCQGRLTRPLTLFKIAAPPPTQPITRPRFSFLHIIYHHHLHCVCVSLCVNAPKSLSHFFILT